MVVARRRRHRLRGKWHPADCEDLAVPHWHVTCRDRDCRWGWLEPVLFDPRPFEKGAA